MVIEIDTALRSLLSTRKIIRWQNTKNITKQNTKKTIFSIDKEDFIIYYVGRLVGGEASLDSIRSRVGTFNIWPGKCHNVANSSVFKTKVGGWKNGNQNCLTINSQIPEML